MFNFAHHSASISAGPKSQAVSLKRGIVEDHPHRSHRDPVTEMPTIHYKAPATDTKPTRKGSTEEKNSFTPAELAALLNVSLPEHSHLDLIG